MPTHLPHRPHLPHHRAARAATVVGAAALVCAAIATPFAIRNAHHDTARRPGAGTIPRPDSAIIPHGALRGDVDGDGADDVVSLGHGDVLRADLGSERSVRQLLQDQPRLEGLADVGAPGLGAVVAGGPHERDWTVWVLHGDRWDRVPTRASEVFGPQAGYATTWVTDRTVYDGLLDPLQKGQHHVAVLARAWSLDDGRLVPQRVGVRCWDRTLDQPPAPCSPGQDWAFDVGPHGDLPPMLPTDPGRAAGPEGVTFVSGDHWQLSAIDASADPETSRWRLEYTGTGGTRSVRVPAGWAPSMYRSPVRVGDLTEGLLVRQEGGDSDTWRVYVRWGGRVQQLVTRGPLPLGGGFGPDGDTAYLSWMDHDGNLYTRIGTTHPARFHVYAWRPVGGTAYDAPVLQAVDLGTVCLDQTLGTYGTCASARWDGSDDRSPSNGDRPCGSVLSPGFSGGRGPGPGRAGRSSAAPCRPPSGRRRAGGVWGRRPGR